MASVKTEVELQLFVSCRLPLLMVETVKDRTSGPLWFLSKAFGTVSHTTLLQAVHDFTLPNTIKDGYEFTWLIVSPT